MTALTSMPGESPFATIRSMGGSVREGGVPWRDGDASAWDDILVEPVPWDF